MKRMLVLAAAAAALALPAAAAAGDSYGTQPGYAVANSHTECAGHGSFGAFGKGNNLAGGANGDQTGLNNAGLCGNRQGNLP